MSVHGPSRHFAAKRRFGRFRMEADINRQAQPVSTVANDPQPTLHAESHLVSAMVRGPQRERRPTSCKFAAARCKPEFPFGFETRAAQITPK
jgi:hypothetical protein